jgi:hypothetical protein
MPLNSTRGAGSAKGFGLTAGIPTIDVDYLVVAGGGSAGSGAGGAGGYRTSFPGGTKIKLVKGVTVPVTVGGGAPAGPAPVGAGSNGIDSSFSTITSTGGGGSTSAAPASPGGSGGGGGYSFPPAQNYIGGTGNSPPTSPSQGNPGGNGEGYNIACEDTNGGGGGASSAGGTVTGAPLGRAGAGGNGAGVPTDFVPASYGTPGPSPTIRYFAGGGGGGAAGTTLPVPSGGYGGGGNGQAFGRSQFCGAPPQGPTEGSAGTVNTGGGGGGGFDRTYAGGSGIVLIRVPAADASKENFTLAPGTNTLVTNPDGSKTAVFTVSGSIKQN